MILRYPCGGTVRPVRRRTPNSSAVLLAAPAKFIEGGPTRFAAKCRLDEVGTVTAMVEYFANSPTMVAVYKDGKKVASTLEDGVEIYGKDPSAASPI